jgi:hypothetical protein
MKQLKQDTVASDLVEAFLSVDNMRLTLKAVGAIVRTRRDRLGRSLPPDPSVRCQLQRHCSRCEQYQGKADLFLNPLPGIWQLRSEIYQAYRVMTKDNEPV